MHDPKMSTVTAHAQQGDSRSHAPPLGSEPMGEDRAAFGCSSSGAMTYSHHQLFHPVPIPLHHYLPFPHQPHHFIAPAGKVGISSRCERVPPLSPPIADAVPSTLPLVPSMSSYALTSSALEAARDLPMHRGYDNSHVASSMLLQHHNLLLPAHVRATERERLLTFMPNAASFDRSVELARWPLLFDLDSSTSAARYYRSLGTADHRLNLAQKTGPAYGLLSPVLARAHPADLDYSSHQGRVNLIDIPLTQTNSMIQSVTSPPAISSLPSSKSSHMPMPPPGLALSIPPTLPSLISSSSLSPTSSLSKRAGALTLASSSCTPTTTMTTTKPASHPSLHSSSFSTSSPDELSPPLSPISQRKRGANSSKSSGLSQQLSQTKFEQHHIHSHAHQTDRYIESNSHSDRQNHHRRFSDSPSHGTHSLDVSTPRLSRKHLWSQVDLEPTPDSPKRPALLTSLSMPATSLTSSLSPPLPPRIDNAHRPSPASNEERSTPGCHGIRQSPSPIDYKPGRPLEDAKFEPFYHYPNYTPTLKSTRDTHPSPSISPVSFMRHSLHQHLLLSTQIKTERLEPWPFNGSIVSGIPPARYSSRGSLHRYDSYNSNPSNAPSNGMVSPQGQGRDCRASPGKELPTRTLKQERARDRQDVTSALDADREHAERLSNIKKCASTQTQFSSFMGESSAPPPPPPYYTTHDTIPHDSILNGQHHSLLSRSSYPHPPPPLHSYYPHSLAHSGANGSISSGTQHPPPSHLSISSRGSSSSSHSTASTSPLSSSSSYLPPPPPSHHPAPSYSNLHHSRHPHASPSPPAGTTPTLPPAPPLVHAPLRSTPPPPPLPPYPGPPLPPPHYREDLSRSGADVQHAPLNLSLSNTATPSQFQPISNGRRSPTSKRVTKGTSSHQRPSSIENGIGSSMSQEDESIEEHFRRSLGKSYAEPAPPPAPAPVSPPVTLTQQKPGNPQPELSTPAMCASQANGEKICSVDDHFARALGDQMWTEIKARSEVASLDGLTDTVDAHFAKALGANMWKKLKEESKGVEDVPVSPRHKQKQQGSKSSLSLVVHSSTKTSSSTPRSPVQAPLVT